MTHTSTETFQDRYDELVKENARLKEWQTIILGTGTDLEAVLRMAATEYAKTAIECWKAENAHLKVELEQARQREARLREALQELRDLRYSWR